MITSVNQNFITDMKSLNNAVVYSLQQERNISCLWHAIAFIKNESGDSLAPQNHHHVFKKIEYS